VLHEIADFSFVLMCVALDSDDHTIEQLQAEKITLRLDLEQSKVEHHEAKLITKQYKEILEQFTEFVNENTRCKRGEHGFSFGPLNGTAAPVFDCQVCRFRRRSLLH
jgi:hypothetical protein